MYKLSEVVEKKEGRLFVAEMRVGNKLYDLALYYTLGGLDRFRRNIQRGYWLEVTPIRTFTEGERTIRSYALFKGHKKLIKKSKKYQEEDMRALIEKYFDKNSEEVTKLLGEVVEKQERIEHG